MVELSANNDPLALVYARVCVAARRPAVHPHGFAVLIRVNGRSPAENHLVNAISRDIHKTEVCRLPALFLCIFAYGSNIHDFEITIYSRRGQRVFHSRDINEEWDGTLNGRPCPQGAYVYTISYTTPSSAGSPRKKNGTVLLVR